MTDLNLLAERCEKATGPDRELDAAIWCAIEGVNLPERIIDDFKHGRPQSFTASLDAAMTLKPSRWRVKTVIESQAGRWRFDLISHDGERDTPFEGHSTGLAATPALALCAAALRSRAIMEKDQNDAG